MAYPFFTCKYIWSDTSVIIRYTTLTEQWDTRNGNSWDHFMMGQIEEWLWKSLAGICPDGTNPSFRHFFIESRPIGDLK
ncbi:hypothetical protein [Dysgonomonas reticulitermitis]